MARSRPTDVVVVGAGAIGLAVAVELRRAGVERVAVVDRNPSAGIGSTSRANGGVRAQFATETDIRFSQHTIRALIELDATTWGASAIGRSAISSWRAPTQAMPRCAAPWRRSGRSGSRFSG